MSTEFLERNEHFNMKLKTSRFKVHKKVSELDVSILSLVEQFHQQNIDFTAAEATGLFVWFLILFSKLLESRNKSA